MHFFLFLEKIKEIVAKIIDKSKRLLSAEKLPFFSENPEFVKAFDELSNHYQKNYTFLDLLEMLTSSVTKLDQLCDKYSKSNINLYKYLSNCVIDVNRALGLVLKLEEEYHSTENNKHKEEKEIEATSLIQACVEMMNYKKSFYTADAFSSLCYLYIGSYLNATVTCKLWDEIDSDDKDKILIIVTGDAHTESLASILKVLYTQIASIPADPRGAIILPDIINEFLKDDFEHVPKENCTCTIL